MSDDVPEPYADYYAHCIAGGVSDAEARAAIARMIHVGASLDSLTCPDCGADLRRERDPRQCGFTVVPGTWHRYRCPACRFACDRCEPLAAEA